MNGGGEVVRIRGSAHRFATPLRINRGGGGLIRGERDNTEDEVFGDEEEELHNEFSDSEMSDENEARGRTTLHLFVPSVPWYFGVTMLTRSPHSTL